MSNAQEVQTRTCQWCGRQAEGFCEHCVAELASRPAPDAMSNAARLDELRWFLEGNGQFCEVPFDQIHGRIEALVGHPVWTHQLGTHGAKAIMLDAEQHFR